MSIGFNRGFYKLSELISVGGSLGVSRQHGKHFSKPEIAPNRYFLSSIFILHFFTCDSGQGTVGWEIL
jgi:hypothetical protein